MIKQFCLYGFLKNQKYFEPFFLLALRQKGCSFFEIGILIGFRALCIILFEIPSGAVADIYGRKRCMILSFLFYIFSFLLLGLCSKLFFLMPAMLFFAAGEAFRTGTHKALIFRWLELKDLINKKTEVYGTTRSWSQYGSAFSSLAALLILLFTKDYNNIFFFCIIPYVAGIINFLHYPGELDCSNNKQVTFKNIYDHLIASLKTCLKDLKIRNLITESAGFLGTHTLTKDYIQPLLKSIVIAIPFFTESNQASRTAVIIGTTYFFIFIISGRASNYAAKFSKRFSNRDKASFFIISLTMTIFAVMTASMLYNLNVISVLCFVFIAVLQNIWRPIYISRLNLSFDNTKGATIMSIESQARSLFVFAVAPLCGILVDYSGFYCLGIIGFLINFIILLKNNNFKLYSYFK